MTLLRGEDISGKTLSSLEETHEQSRSGQAINVALRGAALAGALRLLGAAAHELPAAPPARDSAAGGRGGARPSRHGLPRRAHDVCAVEGAVRQIRRGAARARRTSAR